MDLSAHLPILLINFIYAIGSTLLMILGGVAGYKIFDKITRFDTCTELQQKNMAVAIFFGMVSGSLILGIALVIANCVN